MTNPNHDAGIPTLTEILVAEPVSTPAVSVPEVVLEAAILPTFLMKQPLNDVVSNTAMAPPVTPMPRFKIATAPTADEWKAIEQAVSERVMTQMMSRIDDVLEQRLRERLAEILQTAMIGLSEDIRVGLQQTLEEVVAHAAAQEITEQKKQKT